MPYIKYSVGKAVKINRFSEWKTTCWHAKTMQVKKHLKTWKESSNAWGSGGVDKICFMEKEEKEHVLSISDGFKCS